jgi:hypothetical protein
MIRQGDDIQVVDARTGEDLTRVVLTQIILEDARDQPTGLPLELLRQLIVASDRAGREFIMWYLKSAFDAYHKVQDTVQSGLNDVRSAAIAPLNLVKGLFGGATGASGASGGASSGARGVAGGGASSGASSGNGGGDGGVAAAEVDQLRRRVADLEARLEKKKRPRKRG